MIKQVIAVALVLGLFISCEKVVEPVQTIQVSFSNDIGQESVDGRLLLMLSSDDSDEPRFQINDGLNTQLIFGMNVENWVQDSVLTFDESVFGSAVSVPQTERTPQANIEEEERVSIFARPPPSNRKFSMFFTAPNCEFSEFADGQNCDSEYFTPPDFEHLYILPDTGAVGNVCGAV